MAQTKRGADARDALCHERLNFENFIFPGRGKAVWKRLAWWQNDGSGFRQDSLFFGLCAILDLSERRSVCAEDLHWMN